MNAGYVQTVCIETGSLTELAAELACQRALGTPISTLQYRSHSAPRLAGHFTRMLDISDLGPHPSTVNPLTSLNFLQKSLNRGFTIGSHTLGFFLQLATPQRDQREEEAEDTRDGAGDGPSHYPEDVLLGAQSRGHFSRQPVKYSRGGVRPVTHQLSSLALVASKLCEETPVPVSIVHRGSLRGRGLGPSAASPEGGTLRRNPLPKHFEITQETARLLSKLDSEAVSRTTCADPEESEEHL